MDNKAKGAFWPIILITAFSLLVALLWERVPFTFVKDAVHAALDPSAGALLNWNLTIGMLAVVFVITIITTLIQKYATDQKALLELRQEQKALQQEMRNNRDNPAKINELSKKQMEFIPRQFKLTSRTILFTGIPFILFFRWFYDYFANIPKESQLFFGFLSWFWFYLIFTLIFSGILRKVLKVV